MSILLKNTWQPILNEIWQGLIESVPNDVFFTLLEFYFITYKINPKDKSDALNMIEVASEEFNQIPVPDTEKLCIELLEGFYTSIRDNYDMSIADNYKNNLKRIFEKYNLRYAILNNCRIGLSIQGVLDSMVLSLCNSVKGEAIREQTIQVLEENLAKLDNTFASTKNCIVDASNIVEGAVIDTSTNGKNTLTAALAGCPRDMFAHESLNDAIKSLYKFFSDQPGVRHAGLTTSNTKQQKTSSRKPTGKNTQKNSRLSKFYQFFSPTKSNSNYQQNITNPQTIRNLKLTDAFLSTALAVIFASFVRINDDGKSILDGEI